MKKYLVTLFILLLASCGGDKIVEKKDDKVIKDIVPQKTEEEILIEQAPENEKKAIEAYKNRKYDESLSLIEKTIKGKKESFDIYNISAMIYLNKKEYKNAENSFIQARRFKEDDKETNLLFTNMLIEQKRYKEAAELLETLFAKDATFAEAAVSLLAIYHEFLKEEKDSKKREHLIKKAEEFAQKALKEIPGDAMLYNNLSRIYYIAERKPLAFYTLSIAEKNSPDSPEILNNLGWYYESENNSYLAKVYYEKSLKKDSKYSPALKNMARINMSSLNYKGAKPLFEEILKQDSDNQNAKYGLALCYLGEFDYDNAIKTFENLFETYKKDNYLLVLGDIYYKQLPKNEKYMDKPEKQKEFFTKAKGYFQKYKELHPELGVNSDVIMALSDIDMQIQSFQNPQETKELKEDDKKEVDKDKLEELKKRMKEQEENEGEKPADENSNTEENSKTDSKATEKSGENA
ncbi:tetratricopeptide repeat protein [bacterium]|nr:tetratricopeptide repeat protein [bacterium]